MAIGAAPFGEIPSTAEILNRVSDLMPRAAEHERDQHVVSRVILKQFAEPWGKNRDVFLARLQVRHPERKPLHGNPTRFGKVPDFLRFASSSAEDLWGETETRLHEPLEAIKRDDLIADKSHEGVIRDAIALHFVRSIPMALLHQSAWTDRQEAARRRLRAVPGLVEDIHVHFFGLWTSDPARLELALDEFFKPADDLVASHAIFRVGLEDRLARVQAGFRSFGLAILNARSGEFLIGDVPVLALRDGHDGVGMFSGVGLANADEIALPLTPHHIAVLGRHVENRAATPTEIDRYNRLTISLADTHVHFRIGSRLHEFVRAVAPDTRRV